MSGVFVGKHYSRSRFSDCEPNNVAPRSRVAKAHIFTLPWTPVETGVYKIFHPYGESVISIECNPCLNFKGPLNFQHYKLEPYAIF